MFKKLFIIGCIAAAGVFFSMNPIAVANNPTESNSIVKTESAAIKC